MVTLDVLDNGVRFLTEAMPHVRSVSFGVWLTRGSRHEFDAEAGIAHFVEHMLFKGTERRSAEEIAQVIDALGGQLDAFTAKEYASYYVKVLDEHLPLAVDVLSDIVLRPAFPAVEVERERGVILEEIKMVEDTPDDLVHEIFTQAFWSGHPLGRPILGTKESLETFTPDILRRYFGDTYVAPNVVIAAAGNIEHGRLRDLVSGAFAELPGSGSARQDVAPPVDTRVTTRHKDLEQAHLCVGSEGYPQIHEDRYACYLLNTVLGGSVSSRLFQNIRERHGLAYAVYSGLSAYRDAGMFTIYAGCANERVSDVLDLVASELRTVKRTPVPADELARAKAHLKGSLTLSLESTSSRMSHLARHDIYFGRHLSLDETLEAIERVTAEDLMRVAHTLFRTGRLAVAVVGALNGNRLDQPLSLD